MEEEIFVASKEGVKALGVKIACTAAQLHIYINGKDIIPLTLLDEVRITFEKREEQKQP